MSTISPQARPELVTAVAERYQRSTPAERGRILDEFVALTGYHRKHAIRVLNGNSAMPAVRRGRRSVYDEAVTEGLVVLWEASDRVCGKRLKALLPTLVPALERHGHVTLDPRVREQLMAVSAATIDRRLASARAVTAGQRRRRRSGGDSVRGRVPVRTFGDWQDPAPGFVEADLVAHCGSSMAGSFVWTLVLTDIASGWTECVPLLVRGAGVVVDAVDRLRGALPFPLRGIDTDNGSEFLNEVLIGFCKEHGIELTRSRPYRKNDQAWVEQKNGAVVRRLVGYGRLEGMSGAEALARLYSAARLFVNVFQPSFKLAEKTRVGARVHKRYHAPETPCARLLASDTVPAAMKDRLRALAGTLDPLGLLDEIRAVQHHLAGLAAGSTVHPMPQRDADLDGFLRSLALACALARCGRRTSLARDRRDTGVLGRIRSRRRGPVSSSGWMRNRIGRRKSSSTVCGGSTRGCSSRASSGLCSAASRTGAVSPPVVSCLPIRSERPKALLRHRAQTPIRTTWLPTQRHRSRSRRSGPRSCGPASVSTRCARPSLRYGPAGDTPSVPRLRWQLWALRPGLDGASRPSTTPTGRGGPPDSGWRAGREPVGVGVKRRRQAGGLGSAWSAWCRVRGDFGKAIAAHQGRGAAVLLAPDPHQRRPSGPEHAACRGVLRSRVNRRADSSGH